MTGGSGSGGGGGDSGDDGGGDGEDEFNQPSPSLSPKVDLPAASRNFYVDGHVPQPH